MAADDFTLQLQSPTSGVIAKVNAAVNPKTRTPQQASARWRRKYRKYCHWLVRQQANFLANAGIFALPLIPPVQPQETTALSSVAAVLAGLGYIAAGPNTGRQITPP